jgi:hypothetical protein
MTTRSMNRTVAEFPGWLRAGFWICIVIAVAVVIRRMIALLTAGTYAGSPPLNELDAWFRAHAVLTWVHISVALAFVIMLPFLFRVSIGKSDTLEKAFFILGTTTGATAYGMSRYAVGGWLERSAVLVFDTLFLVSLAKACDAPGRQYGEAKSVDDKSSGRSARHCFYSPGHGRVLCDAAAKSPYAGQILRHCILDWFFH